MARQLRTVALITLSGFIGAVFALLLQGGGPVSAQPSGSVLQLPVKLVVKDFEVGVLQATSDGGLFLVAEHGNGLRLRLPVSLVDTSGKIAYSWPPKPPPKP